MTQPDHDIEEHQLVTLWRTGHSSISHVCKIEQIGESCFELHLLRGRRLLSIEPFDEPEALLDRADWLEHEIHRPAARRR